jgi:hypothetical protein
MSDRVRLTTIRAFSATAHRLKVAAAVAGRSMTDLATDFIEDALDRLERRGVSRLRSAERPTRSSSPDD